MTHGVLPKNYVACEYLLPTVRTRRIRESITKKEAIKKYFCLIKLIWLSYDKE